MGTEVTHRAYPVCEAVVIALMETEWRTWRVKLRSCVWPSWGWKRRSWRNQLSEYLGIAHIGTEATHMAYSAHESFVIACGERA